MQHTKYTEALYGRPAASACPFTENEIAELESLDELLVHLPAQMTAADLCKRFGLRSNVRFEDEALMRSVMTDVDQWFVCSRSKTPEMVFKSATFAKRAYEDEGLYGMDMRRYLAFVGTYRWRYDQLPDQEFWTFLLSGSYDRSGVSIVGFDRFGVLSHHGWMKNFRAKFTGSRYAVIAPRLEITKETAQIPRAYRGRRSPEGLEAAMD
jgi:hypothetical protein